MMFSNDYMVASESCAFASSGYELKRDIKPGELSLLLLMENSILECAQIQL